MTRNWKEVLTKPMPEAPTAVQLLAYVKGYILALEDLLGDIRELDQQWASDQTPGMEVASDALIDKIHQSLGEAHHTLERLQ